MAANLNRKSDMTDPVRRRTLKSLLATAGALMLSGCDRLSRSTWFTPILRSADHLNDKMQHALTPRAGMAKEYAPEFISPSFRANGNTNPNTPVYNRLAENNFIEFKIRVGGLVMHPLEMSLADIQALPSRTQITRHDCVEGWSAIGKWKGARLSALLEKVQPLPDARFVVFYCADRWGSAHAPYYESIDLEDARHEQTLLAYELNDAPLPIANGAPLRLRVERQLGYKMAKYIMAIELVESFDHIGDGNGGFWEDRGYAWYAGI